MRIVITGAEGSLGRELVRALTRDGHTVFPCTMDVSRPDMVTVNSWGEVDILVNCAGYNKLNWIEDITEEDWEFSMDANAKGILKMTQALLPKLIKSRGSILNVISDADRRPMTCSLAYNASKAAANMMTQQMARELTRRYGIAVFGISTNKLTGSAMSNEVDKQVCKLRGWTPEYARAYQLDSLLRKEETPIKVVTDFIVYLLAAKYHHTYLSGCVIPYGA